MNKSSFFRTASAEEEMLHHNFLHTVLQADQSEDSPRGTTP